MRFLLLPIFFLTTPALAAEQFDLACQGTRVARRDGPAEPYGFRARIDLTRKKWCVDACERAADIVAISPERIVLADDATYNTRTDFTNAVQLDPKSHAFRQLMIEERPQASYLKIEAKCTPQPFTPFPGQ